MIIENTSIDGLFILKPTIFRDKRGYFTESYNQKKMNDLIENINFVQDNDSKSVFGTVRGLHFQTPPFSQTKLIRCIKGEILDVTVDLRKNSTSFGQIERVLLSDKNNHQLFIPKGFAHGFSVLSNFAIVSYKVDNYYNSEYENGILWNDSSLGIDWKLKAHEVIVSEKDKSLPHLNNIVSPF